MSNPTQLVNELALHLGADNGISAEHLALRLGITTRTLRRMISGARDQGIAICGTPGTGYYMPSNADELPEGALENALENYLALALDGYVLPHSWRERTFTWSASPRADSRASTAARAAGMVVK